MTGGSEGLFLCPGCRESLPVSGSCLCGFAVRECEGIIQLMTEEEIAGKQPFIRAYEQVRRAETWGDDDLDLPFHAKRHREIWNIRRRTFRVFQSVAATLERGDALDVGAGNCWMTRYLDAWGFQAIAVDVNDSATDGLQAGGKFIADGAGFLRVLAGMERLPFASRRIRLLAINASFHYARDYMAALSEFERVLAPGGVIAIIDTPFYENGADGERMVAQRAASFRRNYGMNEALARSARYLTFKELEDLASSVHLKWSLRYVWPGFKRKYEEIRARLFGDRIAQFPVVILEHA